MEVYFIILAAIILLTPPLSLLWERSIAKKSKILDPNIFVARWSRIFFWVTAGLGCIPFGAIIFAYIDLEFPLKLYGILFFLIPLIIAVIFCLYFLRKKIAVYSIQKKIVYYPAFGKKLLISCEDIIKVDENQHGMSVFLADIHKKVFSIGHGYIGYELLKKFLKKNNKIQFSYKETGY